MPRRALLVLALLAPHESEPARRHGGKIYVVDALEVVSDAQGAELDAWLDSRPATKTVEVTHKGPRSAWSVQFLAVLSNRPQGRRLALKVEEVGGAKRVLLRRDMPTPASHSIVFRAAFVAAPEAGFRGGSTYRLELGEQSRDRTVALAQGSFTLVD